MRKVIVSLVKALLATSVITVFGMQSFAGTNYTPVAGTSTTFNKFLIVPAGTNSPEATFNFTVAAGQARSIDTADNGVMEVLAGIGTPTVTPTVFTSSDALNAAVQTGHIDVAREASDRVTGGTAVNGVQLDLSAGEKYAVKTATISFTGIQFPEPGIYRYIVSETANAANAAKGIIHDTDTDRVLDVYVTDDDGSLVVSGYVMHKNDADVAIGANMGSADVSTDGTALTDKTDGFTNEYKPKDLAFKKEVIGNEASRDKYFDFTLALTGLGANQVVNVSLADDSNANTFDGNADSQSGSNAATIAANAGKTNPTTITAAADGTATVHFYLQHGQHVVVHGLPLDATYAVTENAEDYLSTPKTVTGFTDETSGTIGTIAGSNPAVKTSYMNRRGGTVPTGIIVKVLPGIALLAIAIVVFFLFGRKRKHA